MHHKSTAKLGTGGVPSKHPLVLTLHIPLQNGVGHSLWRCKCSHGSLSYPGF